MKNKYFTIFISILLFSCNQNKNIIIFKHQKDITLSTPSNKKLPYSVFLNETKKSKIFTVFFRSNELISYDLIKKEIIDTIPLKYTKKRLYSFNYYNKDSIFLLFNASTASDYFHDSIFMMINKHGDIKNVYSMKNAPVKSSENFPISSNITYVSSNFQTLKYKNHKLYTVFSIKRKIHGLYNVATLPPGGHINIKENKFYLHKVIIAPIFKDKFYSQKYEKVYTCLTKTGNIVYSFPYTSEIQIYNPETEEIVKRSINSCLFDSIIPSNTKEKNYDLYNARYSNMYYNKYTNKFYRFVKLPAKPEDSPAKKNKDQYSLIIADKNFNIIGEGILPENLAHLYLFFSKEGTYFFNSTSLDNNKNEIIYSLYTLEYSKGNKNDLLMQLNSETIKDESNKFGLIPYIENFNISKKLETVIILIPTASSCPSCVNFVCKYYVENTDMFFKNNIYLILSDRNITQINDVLNNNNLKREMKNLIVDDSGIYLNYIENFTNPRLYIIRNDSIIFDKIYNPGDLFDLHLN